MMFSAKMSKTSDYNCQDVLIQRKIDLCKFSDELNNSMIMKFLMRELVRSASFDFKCPYKSGTYMINNFTMTTVPKLPFQGDLYGCTNIKVYAKLFSTKKFTNVANFKIQSSLWKSCKYFLSWYAYLIFSINSIKHRKKTRLAKQPIKLSLKISEISIKIKFEKTNYNFKQSWTKLYKFSQPFSFHKKTSTPWRLLDWFYLSKFC